MIQDRKEYFKRWRETNRDKVMGYSRKQAKIVTALRQESKLRRLLEKVSTEELQRELQHRQDSI